MIRQKVLKFCSVIHRGDIYQHCPIIIYKKRTTCPQLKPKTYWYTAWVNSSDTKWEAMITSDQTI